MTQCTVTMCHIRKHSPTCTQVGLEAPGVLRKPKTGNLQQRGCKDEKARSPPVPLPGEINSQTSQQAWWSQREGEDEATHMQPPRTKASAGHMAPQVPPHGPHISTTGLTRSEQHPGLGDVNPLYPLGTEATGAGRASSYRRGLWNHRELGPNPGTSSP